MRASSGRVLLSSDSFNPEVWHIPRQRARLLPFCSPRNPDERANAPECPRCGAGMHKRGERGAASRTRTIRRRKPRAHCERGPQAESQPPTVGRRKPHPLPPAAERPGTVTRSQCGRSARSKAPRGTGCSPFIRNSTSSISSLAIIRLRLFKPITYR